MISVIIPYYNPDSNPHLEQLLARAVKSAVDQTADIQVIVVDDGSPAPPDNIINEYIAGYNIKLIKAPHGRLGAARNWGIDSSDGDIIAFLDADDYYFPHTLKPCVNAMESKEADLLRFNFLLCGENGAQTPANNPFVFSCPETGSSIMRRNNLFGSSCMYLIRRSLLTRNNLRFAENSFMEDEDFTPRLLFYSKRMITTEAIVYAYCRREGSITTSPIYEERARNTINVINRLIEFRDSVCQNDDSGIIRKIRYLAMDHIRLTLRRPDWKKSIDSQISILRNIGLWPLKSAAYGFRYRLFTALSHSRAGLYLLHINEKRYIR